MTKLNVKASLKTKSGKTTYVYPFQRVPKGQVINISNISNPLDPKKLARPKLKTLADAVAELEANPKIQEWLRETKAKGTMFDPAKIGRVAMEPIGLTRFNEIVQRVLDTNHCYDILQHLNEGLLSPIFAVDTGSGLDAFDTQHGSTIVGLLAKHGLWKGQSTDDWQNFLFPYFLINNPSPNFQDEAALHRNGKGQKPWDRYEYHKVYVAAVRKHGITSNKIYLDAAKRQDICEQEEAIPLPKNHPQRGKAGTLDRVDVIYDWSLDELRFILRTHKAYWHGTKVDSAAWGLYGNLYKGMKKIGVPMKGKDWNTYLDNFNATIFEVFTDLATGRSAVIEAHRQWHKKAYPNLKTTPNPDNDCFLAIVEKIYLRKGGQHLVTGHAYDYNYNGFDIIDFLPQEYLDIVDNA